MNSASEIAF